MGGGTFIERKCSLNPNRFGKALQITLSMLFLARLNLSGAVTFLPFSMNQRNRRQSATNPCPSQRVKQSPSTLCSTRAPPCLDCLLEGGMLRSCRAVGCTASNPKTTLLQAAEMKNWAFLGRQMADTGWRILTLGGVKVEPKGGGCGGSWVQDYQRQQAQTPGCRCVLARRAVGSV